jgi:predicted ATP-dependent Lon-type protease
MLIASEALLLFPLPDPFAILRTSEANRFHRFLPGWNAFGDWFG